MHQGSPFLPRFFLALLGPLALLGSTSAQAPPASASPPVTFTRDIAPIVLTKCAGCHRPDGPAPFSLITYEDTRRRARLIADVTERRLMPPWKPSADSGPFVDDRSLSATQIQLFRRWLEAGLLEGPARALPDAPRSPAGWQLGEPDLIVRLPAYDVPAEGADIFRNFAAPAATTDARYVRALEIRTGNRAVHHVTVRVDPTHNTRRLDDADAAPGYEGLIPFSAEHPAGHLVGWTPGQVPAFLPQGLSWRLPASSDLVVQLHLQPTGRVERVEPAIGLYFTADAPRQSPVVVRLGSQNIQIPAGAMAYQTRDSFVLPVDVDVLSIQPHAHYRARQVRAEAMLSDGSVRSLLRIDDWDFNWQDVYRYARPVALPAGTRVDVALTFDNSAGNPRNPAVPPVPVIWGPRSADEMGDVMLQLMPRSARDLDRLAAAARIKMLEQDVDGMELQVNAHLADAGLRTDLADTYMQLGKPEKAAPHFETVAVLRPQSAPAHYNHGVALQETGLLDRAVTAYARAIAIDRAYAQPHQNLGVILVARGAREQALTHFETAASLYAASGRRADATQAASAARRVAINLRDTAARRRIEAQLDELRRAGGREAQ